MENLILNEEKTATGGQEGEAHGIGAFGEDFDRKAALNIVGRYIAVVDGRNDGAIIRCKY